MCKWFLTHGTAGPGAELELGAAELLAMALAAASAPLASAGVLTGAAALAAAGWPAAGALAGGNLNPNGDPTGFLPVTRMAAAAGAARLEVASDPELRSSCRGPLLLSRNSSELLLLLPCSCCCCMPENPSGGIDWGCRCWAEAVLVDPSGGPCWVRAGATPLLRCRLNGLLAPSCKEIALPAGWIPGGAAGMECPACACGGGENEGLISSSSAGKSL